jgi:hypothetical protein
MFVYVFFLSTLNWRDIYALMRNDGMYSSGPKIIGYECQGETNEEFWKKHGRPDRLQQQQQQQSDKGRERERDFESLLSM